MRRQFSIIIIFFLVFHFLLPCLYFLIYGFVNLYSDVQGYVGCLINIISLLGTLFIIKKMPTMDSAPLKEYNHLSSFFWCPYSLLYINFIVVVVIRGL